MEKVMKMEIMEKYNSTYKGYDRLYGEEQREKYREIISEVNSVENKVIIDIGCGTGLIERRLKKSRFTVGLDISIKMLRKAVKRFRGKLNYSWINADAENIPIRDNSIDLALMITVIQNIPNKNKVISEIERILKNNGITIITYPKSHFTLEEALKEIQQSNLKIMGINDKVTKDIIIKLKKVSN
ncbi:MAG: methyltransferase domain-containing protein [Candidatus Methanomethylicia archaeon]